MDVDKSNAHAVEDKMDVDESRDDDIDDDLYQNPSPEHDDDDSDGEGKYDDEEEEDASEESDDDDDEDHFVEDEPAQETDGQDGRSFKHGNINKLLDEKPDLSVEDWGALGWDVASVPASILSFDWNRLIPAGPLSCPRHSCPSKYV